MSPRLLALAAAISLGGCNAALTGVKLSVAFSEKNLTGDVPLASPPDFSRARPAPVGGCIPLGVPCP